MNAFLLWIAQGFGVGRIPFAPGTFGSVVGLLWFGVLLLTGLWVPVALGTGIAAWFGLTESRICQSHAQTILGLRGWLQRVRNR